MAGCMGRGGTVAVALRPIKIILAKAD